MPEPRDARRLGRIKIADFELIQEIVRSIRNLRAEKNVAPSKRSPRISPLVQKQTCFKEQSSHRRPGRT